MTSTMTSQAFGQAQNQSKQAQEGEDLCIRGSMQGIPHPCEGVVVDLGLTRRQFSNFPSPRDGGTSRQANATAKSVEGGIPPG